MKEEERKMRELLNVAEARVGALEKERDKAVERAKREAEKKTAALEKELAGVTVSLNGSSRIPVRRQLC